MARGADSFAWGWRLRFPSRLSELALGRHRVLLWRRHYRRGDVDDGDHVSLTWLFPCRMLLLGIFILCELHIYDGFGIVGLHCLAAIHCDVDEWVLCGDDLRELCTHSNPHAHVMLLRRVQVNNRAPCVVWLALLSHVRFGGGTVCLKYFGGVFLQSHLDGVLLGQFRVAGDMYFGTMVRCKVHTTLGIDGVLDFTLACIAKQVLVIPAAPNVQIHPGLEVGGGIVALSLISQVIPRLHIQLAGEGGVRNAVATPTPLGFSQILVPILNRAMD